MNDLAKYFEREKYLVLRSLVKEPLLSSCYKYALKRAETDTMLMNDSQAPGTPSAYADPMMEMLLQRLVRDVELATTLKVYPTYAYFRVYKRGDVLAKHKDRPSCEISLSVSLGFQADASWPLWLEGPNGVSRVSMNPGDGVLYRGMECFHWREAFDGDHAAQVFLHYVDQNGPHAEWRFDKREKLASFIRQH